MNRKFNNIKDMSFIDEDYCSNAPFREELVERTVRMRQTIVADIVVEVAPGASIEEIEAEAMGGSPMSALLDSGFGDEFDLETTKIELI